MATRKTKAAAATLPPTEEEQFSTMERDDSYLFEAPPQDAGDLKASLARVSEMAHSLRMAQKAFVEATLTLDAAKAELDRIEEVDFPDLLKEVGLTDLTLDDGAKLSLVEDIRCGISEDRKPRAFDWLRRHNFDGIIKSSVSVQFDKGEGKAMKALFLLLMKKKLNPEAKETVHPATLKSLLKEQRSKPVLETDTDAQKAAKQPPADVFAIFPFSKVKLKEAKK